jgi:hypothetical protein
MKDEAEATSRIFLNTLQVVEYLKSEGWKLSKSAAYAHVKEGMLRCRDDGHFHERDVLKYARTFLKMKDGSTVSRELESLSREKSQVELRRMNAEAKIKEHKLEILAGNLVPRSRFELALTERLILFRQHLMYFGDWCAPEIIRLVSGDMAKVSDLIRFMRDKFEDFLHVYSRKKEFMIDAADLAAELERDAEDNDDEEEEIGEPDGV